MMGHRRSPTTWAAKLFFKIEQLWMRQRYTQPILVQH